MMMMIYSVTEEDFDSNEAGSEVEATASDEHDRHTAEKDSQPGSSENGDRLSESDGSLPELLPKKGTTSEVWCHFGLRHEGGMIIEKDKPVCKHCNANVSAKDGNTTNCVLISKQAPGCVCYNQNEVITAQKKVQQ